jgi:AcrR family transcriptional regulator
MSLPSPTDVTSLDAHRGPGRPRDARADHAILDATLDLAGSVGLAGITMDAVAAHAGVSKATIYRRWSSKEALVLDAWMACFDEDAVPNTGSLREDLLDVHRRAKASVQAATLARVLPQMVAAARVNEELGRVYANFVADRRQRFKVVLERAVERGELPPDTDIDLVFDLLNGPLFYRTLLSGEPVAEDVLERVIDVVVTGVGALAKSARSS